MRTMVKHSTPTVGRRARGGRRWLAAAALPLALLAQAANADDGTAALPWKRAALQLGVQALTFDSEMALNTSSGNLGTSINLEEVLGLDEDISAYRVGGYWRVWPRHRLDLEYYEINRAGSQAATIDFDFGDIAIGAGAQLDTELNINTLKASYSYSFIQNRRWDVTGGLGLHAMDIGLRLTASGAVVIKDPDGVALETDGAVTDSVDALAPLPVLSAGVAYAFTDRLFLRTRADVFAIEIGNYGGHMFDGILGLDYDVSKHFGIGAALNVVRMGVEAKDDDFRGSLDYNYEAAMIYARLFM